MKHLPFFLMTIVLLGVPILIFMALMPNHAYSPPLNPVEMAQKGAVHRQQQQQQQHHQQIEAVVAPASSGFFKMVRPSGFYDFVVENIDGESYSMSELKGKVVLVVNVASRCEFTDTNYIELVRLHKLFDDRDFEILAFPCNQFGQREPGTAAEIKSFVRGKYHVPFPLLKKVKVNGQHADPLFSFIKSKFDMFEIPWNFQKFLIDQQGTPVYQFSPQTSPLSITKYISMLLEKTNNPVADDN